jgi:hypothetical protein
MSGSSKNNDLMKKITHRYIFSVCMVAVALMSVTGCKKDDGESSIDRTERLLTAATWELSRLTVDGTDQTARHTGMTLTVSANTYTAENGEPVWPTSGTWTLVDASTIDRDNDVMVTIETLNENALIVSMEWTQTTYGPGRTASSRGNHVFEFVRK